MSDVRIERLTNGYVVRVRDPKIVKQNERPGRDGPWKDPDREFVFTTVEQVLAWLKANLDKALPEDDFSTAFDMAAAELEEEKDE